MGNSCMQKRNIKQREMPFQMYEGSLPQRNCIQKWCAVRDMETMPVQRNDPITRFALIFKHNELLEQILPSNCGGMLTTEKTRINENRTGVEHSI